MIERARDGSFGSFDSEGRAIEIEDNDVRCLEPD